MSTMEDFAISKPSEGVVLIVNQSKPLGVLGFDQKAALLLHLKDLYADPSVKCVVITGSGTSFSVGSNIKEFQHDERWLTDHLDIEMNLNDYVEHARFPVIAACNGHTFGAGLLLALSSDFRLASETAVFGFPEVKVGAFATSSGTQRLPRLLGSGRALYLMLTGQNLSARQALEWGLVEEVLPAKDLVDRAIELAVAIADSSAPAVEASKRCVRIGQTHGWHTGLLEERRLTVSVGLSDEAREGRMAFLEKRPPKFQFGK